MGRNFHFILISLLMIVVGSSARLFAYPTPFDVDGAMHKWPITVDAPNVYYDINASDESLKSYLEPLVDDAAALWTDVETALISLDPADNEHPAQITLHFRSSIEGGDTAAGYSIFDEVEEGVPTHCSIYISASVNSNFEALQKTILHEIGHCLGLAHSLVPSSIMSYQLEQNTFALALDDKAAISRIYPLDGSGAKLPPGCSIGSPPNDGRNLRLYLLLFAVPGIFTMLSKSLQRKKIDLT